MNVKKGFTLLEILVVVGIIGILVGVVLSVFSSARTSAADATIKSSLGSMRKEASIYFNYTSLGNGLYNKNGLAIAKNGPCVLGPLSSYWNNTVFEKGSRMEELLIQAIGGRSSALSRCYLDGAGVGWVAAVVSHSDDTKYFCSDHYGAVKLVDNPGSTPLGTLMSGAANSNPSGAGIPICP